MMLVDTVGWLAYLKNDPLAAAYELYLLAPEGLLCSALSVFEVCRHIERSAGRRAAAEAAALMKRTQVIVVDTEIATTAAALSLAHRLATADAVIYATAQLYGADLVTSDAHFSGLQGVTFIPHPNRPQAP